MEPVIIEEKVSVSAQLPKDLDRQLRRIAKKEGRSFAAQVRIFLADSVTRHNTASAAGQHATACAAQRVRRAA